MNMPNRFKNKYSNISLILQRFWFFYFMLTIAILGFASGYLTSVPLYLIGTIWGRSGKLADRIMCRSIRLLMDVQPWFNGTFDLNLPQSTSSQGLLLISNHRSHLDSFLLLSRVAGIRILAKKTLFYVPFLGFMMRVMRQIPAKRGRIDSFLHAMEIVRQRLKSGEVVHIFPEMTRCSEGFAGLQDFTTYPFLVAIQEKVTIVPIVFYGTDQAWPKGKNLIRFRRLVKMTALAPINSAQFSSAAELKNEVRRLIEDKFQGNCDDHSRLPVHSHLQQQPSH